MDEVRVVVVDDQETFLRAVRAVVEATEGFALVAEARTGEESLRVVGASAPDLVLMDVHLPGMDGVEATCLLTSQPTAPVVLLLSTYPAEEVDWSGCGAAGYLEKASFGPDRLSAAWAAVHR